MRCGRPKWMLRQLFQVFFLSVLSVLVIGAVVAYLLYFLPGNGPKAGKGTEENRGNGPPQNKLRQQSSRLSVEDNQLIPLELAPIKHVSLSSSSLEKVDHRHGHHLDNWRDFDQPYHPKCSMFSCFDIHRCGTSNLSIYIYPVVQYFVNGQRLQSQLSLEFYQFLQAIRRSPYYVSDPQKACVFVPSIDLLNLNHLQLGSKELMAVFQSLSFWGKSGQNHLLVTLFPGNSPLLQLKTNAIIATSGLSSKDYRLGFHVPMISPGLAQITSEGQDNLVKTGQWIAVAILQGHTDLATTLSSTEVLLLDWCSSPKEKNYSLRCSVTHGTFNYPGILGHFSFCLVVNSLASPVLWEVMKMGCIPVIISTDQRLPFDSVLDWSQFSIQLYPYQLSQLGTILKGISVQRRLRLKQEVKWVWGRYFSGMDKMTGILMEVLKDRVFSHFARTRRQWSLEDTMSMSPFFNPVTAPKPPGFTAVILAYERIASLFSVVSRVSQVPSVVKILVIWNNQQKEPPKLDTWPKVPIPVKIIKAEANKLSNRFWPYDEIETEAVFSLDDDIVMLTVDEMQFAFEAWREFPERLVGFPSRSHVWDNGTQRWKYESEWGSEISMVLTGAAFYHKYWHYAYTYELPRDIRDWVDAKMNCEDIAMNFLVASRTGKPPIKVTPRKKFKCPTCNNNEMLSSDTGHMVERTECINRFTQIFGGRMPLVATEFRVDPVLFKVEGVPGRLKWYRDMGTM